MKGGIKMITSVQKWGNSLGIRIPKYILESTNIKENDNVDIKQRDNIIIISKPNKIPHKTLEERLTEFYKKPLDQITVIESAEIDWGKKAGEEEW